MTGSVLTIGLSPAFEKVLVFPSFRENEVNRSTFHTLSASGKAINVTRVLGKLGRTAVNITQLGGPRVREFLALAEKENIRVRFVETEAETRVCTTLINEEKGTSTELVEEANEVEAGVSEKMYYLFLDEIPHHSAVTVSGTKAKGFSDTLIPRIVGECGRRGVLTVLDIRGKDLLLSLKKHPSVIKPNISEFCSTFSVSKDKAEVEEKTREIYDTYGACTVITRGPEPSWCFDGKKFLEIVSPVEIEKAVNTIGCGDTLTGVLTHSLLLGRTLEEAVREGMAAATHKAEHRSFDFCL